jgi:hypothetical protein
MAKFNVGDKIRPFVWVAVLGGVVLFFIATSLPAGAWGGQSPNTDPHNGQVVKLFPADNDISPVTKRCDGPNLVYLTPYQDYGGGSIAVIPDSVECR